MSKRHTLAETRKLLSAETNDSIRATTGSDYFSSTKYFEPAVAALEVPWKIVGGYRSYAVSTLLTRAGEISAEIVRQRKKAAKDKKEAAAPVVEAPVAPVPVTTEAGPQPVIDQTFRIVHLLQDLVTQVAEVAAQNAKIILTQTQFDERLRVVEAHVTYLENVWREKKTVDETPVRRFVGAGA